MRDCTQTVVANTLKWSWVVLACTNPDKLACSFSARNFFVELALLVPATVDASLYNKVRTPFRPVLQGKTVCFRIFNKFFLISYCFCTWIGASWTSGVLSGRKLDSCSKRYRRSEGGELRLRPMLLNFLRPQFLCFGVLNLSF